MEVHTAESQMDDGTVSLLSLYKVRIRLRSHRFLIWTYIHKGYTYILYIACTIKAFLTTLPRQCVRWVDVNDDVLVVGLPRGECQGRRYGALIMR